MVQAGVTARLLVIPSVAVSVLGLVGESAAAPWWHRYTPVASSPTRIQNLEAVNAGAVRAAGYHGGWYGFWELDDQRRTGLAERTWAKVGALGATRVMYYDSGEMGDYAGFFAPDRRMLHHGWSLPWWEGEPVTARWFGIGAFMQNVEWAPYPTASHYGLSSFTAPDGAPVEDVYAVLSRRDLDGQWKFDYFSNARVTDDMAERSGLAAISGRQEAGETVAGKTGWQTTRLIHVDYSNPQLRDYRCRELAWLIPQIKPEGIHIDNHGDLNILYPRGAAFGDWSRHGFSEWMAERFTEEQLAEMEISDIRVFDIRAYIRDKPFETRGKRGQHWINPKWTEDLVWKCYLLSKVESGLDFHRRIYRTAKNAARDAGLECMVGGNVIPAFPGRALMRGACDIAIFEWKTVGRFGPLGEMGLPPRARVGYVTRLGAAIGDAPFCWPGIYVPKDLSGPGHENLHKVLAADCLVNRGLLDYGHWFLDGYSPGTPESAGFMNRFVNATASRLSNREYMADVGLVYCPWTEIAALNVAMLDTSMFFDEYAGWAKFLCDTHRQWDVLLSQDISADALARFPIVVLPSIMVLTDGQVSELARYVQEGGRLVATGLSGSRRGPEGYLVAREGNALEALATHPNVRVITDTPGSAYWAGDGDETASGSMSELLAFAGLQSRVQTDAPATVGANLNLGQDAGQPLMTLDLNNYDLDVESDTIRSALSSSTTIRLPDGWGPEGLRVSYVYPEMEDASEPVPLQGRKWTVDEQAGLLTLTTPAFETCLVVYIEAPGQTGEGPAGATR